MSEAHMVTMDDLHEEMRGGHHWRGEAKRYEALWRSALSKQAMCSDHVKGDVEITYTWDDGKQDTRKMHSDEAERLLSQIAHAAVFHGRTRDVATVTLTVRRAVK